MKKIVIENKNLETMKPNYHLILSSSSFLLPAFYGFKKGYRLLPAMSFITTLVSIQYWIHPIPGRRKNMDLFTSKVCGILYFIHGYFHVSSLPLRRLGYLNAFFILTTYNMSCLLHSVDDKSWLLVHILFHSLVSLGKMIVIGY